MDALPAYLFCKFGFGASSPKKGLFLTFCGWVLHHSGNALCLGPAFLTCSNHVEKTVRKSCTLFLCAHVFETPLFALKLLAPLMGTYLVFSSWHPPAMGFGLGMAEKAGHLKLEDVSPSFVVCFLSFCSC